MPRSYQVTPVILGRRRGDSTNVGSDRLVDTCDMSQPVASPRNQPDRSDVTTRRGPSVTVTCDQTPSPPRLDEAFGGSTSLIDVEETSFARVTTPSCHTPIKNFLPFDVTTRCLLLPAGRALWLTTVRGDTVAEIERSPQARTQARQRRPNHSSKRSRIAARTVEGNQRRLPDRFGAKEAP